MKESNKYLKENQEKAIKQMKEMVQDLKTEIKATNTHTHTHTQTKRNLEKENLNK